MSNDKLEATFGTEENLFNAMVRAWHFNGAGEGMTFQEYAGLTEEQFKYFERTGEMPEGWTNGGE